MELNKTYSQKEMLSAMISASETWQQVAKKMKKTGAYHLDFVAYEHEGMLTSSIFARVTMTRKVSDTRWEGFMETGAFADGPKVPVAINCVHRVLFANDDFTKFTEWRADPVTGYPIEELCTYTIKGK